jgi:secreted PhoX family phosphatase
MKSKPHHAPVLSSAPTASGLGRRSFLKGGALVVAGLASVVPFQALLHRQAGAAQLPYSPDYGPLAPVNDETTGLPLLLLPAGFRYLSFGWTGDPLRDGTPTPALHDGMAVVASDQEHIVLVRNHEIGPGTPFAPAELTYDAGAGGGTTNVSFDPRAGQWLDSWASLSGTVRNCAGGPTYRDSWLTCEETLLDPATEASLTSDHGWIFEVPGFIPAAPVPLLDMGRFSHEAVAVDPVTVIVYETEDSTPAGFYRFLPNNPALLSEGGTLQMLMVSGEPQRDLSQGVAVGTTFNVVWVNIPNPQQAHTPETTDGHGVFMQGFAQGGASFTRLEGCWYDSGNIFFTSTNGGIAGEGQVWQYDPRREELTLIFESPAEEVLDNPDNITISPRGGILLCEDGDRLGQRLIGLTPAGEVFPFAENNIVLNGEKNGFVGDFRGEEWAGATYSPDTRWLFVNIQTPGITFAITGPWDNGAL